MKSTLPFLLLPSLPLVAALHLARANYFAALGACGAAFERGSHQQRTGTKQPGEDMHDVTWKFTAGVLGAQRHKR